jgi:hypothetical protein
MLIGAELRAKNVVLGVCKYFCCFLGKSVVRDIASSDAARRKIINKSTLFFSWLAFALQNFFSRRGVCGCAFERRELNKMQAIPGVYLCLHHIAVCAAPLLEYEMHQ